MTQQTPWIITHIPHSSRSIPDDVRDQFIVSDAELMKQLDILTDHYTDELFTINHPEVANLKFPVSRFVVDPERFDDDSQEPMSKQGQEVIYMKTTDLKPLRRTLQDTERTALLNQYYRPHHQVLETLVEMALSAHGKALIIDGHSFPNKPLAVDLNQQADRPDICLGTDSFHTPQQLIDDCTELFRNAGFSVEVNHPYAGTMVPLKYYGKDNRVSSILIEVNRRVYLRDEPVDLTRTAGFFELQQLICQLINLIQNKKFH